MESKVVAGSNGVQGSKLKEATGFQEAWGFEEAWGIQEAQRLKTLIVCKNVYSCRAATKSPFAAISQSINHRTNFETEVCYWKGAAACG